METAAAAPTEPLEARAERTLLLYRIGRTGVLVHSLLVGSAVYMFWDHVFHPWLMGWAGLMWAITGWRALYCRRITARQPAASEMPRYQSVYDLMILLTGLWWAVGTTLLYVPGEPGLQAFLALLVGGTSAGAVGTLSAHMPTVMRALLPALLALSGNFLLRGEDQTIMALGVLMLLFLAALTVVARNFNSTLRDALRLRYELAEKTRAQEADIAHRKAVEAELREANRRAETAVAAKNRFLARASHDLRQPLHALGLLVATLDRRLTAEADRDILWRIDQSVESMALLFNALLDISRLDAGAVRPEVRPFRLHDLLAPIVEEFRMLAEVKDLHLIQVRTDAVVESDPALLSAIVRNLLSNAVRYTDRGRILIGCRRRGDRLSLEVWDTGIGIPADQQGAVFEEFTQVTREHEGGRQRFGLGLSIVRRLGEVLDHPIALRSRPGRGSVFTVSLPLRGTGEVAPLTVQGTRRLSLDDLRVLVVDDDDEVREAMRLLIEGWGGRVAVAADAGSAPVIAAAHRPDVLIVDLELPDGDGRDVIKAVEAACDHPIPAIIITGDTLAQPQPGDGTFLHKPVAPARLRTVINRYATPHPA